MARALIPIAQRENGGITATQQHKQKPLDRNPKRNDRAAFVLSKD